MFSLQYPLPTTEANPKLLVRVKGRSTVLNVTSEHKPESNYMSSKMYLSKQIGMHSVCDRLVLYAGTFTEGLILMHLKALTKTK